MVVFSITVHVCIATVIEKTTINVTFDLRYYATFKVRRFEFLFYKINTNVCKKLPVTLDCR